MLKTTRMKYFLMLFFSFNSAFSQVIPNYYEMSLSEFQQLTILDEVIDVRNPNNALLDAALFHFTNAQRLAHNLPLFIYSPILHKSSVGHSEAMINQHFYSHENPYNPTVKTLPDRVFSQSKLFRQLAENIAEHDIISTKNNLFCILPPKNGTDYTYIDCDTKKHLPMQTYSTFAQNVIMGWMNSPHHRDNILDIRLKALGCSGRVAKNPYKTTRSPFARLTQNFGN